MAWITYNKGNAMRSHRLIIFCALAALLGLPTHVVADATGDFSLPPEASQGADESNTADTDLLADAALPAAVNTVSLEPLVFPLNHPSLTRLAWFPSPPVHPPIVLN
jgi:hypothetical protein